MRELTLEIVQDEDAQNPRTDFDNLSKMVVFWNRYNLGDEHNFDKDSAHEFLAKIQKEGAITMPLYIYEHGGISISASGFSCPWDSGCAGFIYCTKEMIKKEYKSKRVTKKMIEEVKKVLLGEVKTYDQYLIGDVYGYIIKDNEGETVESCWGYYGHDYCEKEGKSMLKYVLEREKKEEKKLDNCMAM